MIKHILITGANRGIGLELARQYAALGHYVYAICRSETQAFKNLQNVHVIAGIDVTKSNDIAKVISALNNITIDLLINNAGIMTEETLDNLNVEAIEYQLLVNALAPVVLTHALIGSFSFNAKVALVTSRMGSISDNNSGGFYGYRMSKAALNAAGKSLANDLLPHGISVNLIHPGHVKTELFDHSGEITAVEAADNLINRIDEMHIDNTGLFVHANGTVLAW